MGLRLAWTVAEHGLARVGAQRRHAQRQLRLQGEHREMHAERAARRPKPSKLTTNSALRDYVQDRLAGQVANPDGVGFSGTDVVWKERRAVHRQSRRWLSAWSPEQIAHRLWLDFPEDPTMRIRHEAIYQSLYIQGRGALRRKLIA